MCFSATASFAASGALVALGGASLVVAKKEDKILAAIPLLFGVQQALEGVQWLYLNAGASSLLAGYGFLFFAFIVWPIYAPTAVFMLDKKRRKILGWFIALGVAVALYFFWLLLNQPLAIQELRACVNYSLGGFPFAKFIYVAYPLVVFGPLFLSSRKLFNWFGVAIAVFAIISWFFFTVDFISVWCFFSAVISSMFFLYIRSRRTRTA